MNKKYLVAVIAIALVLCCAVGGTIAYLIDTTDPVVNTFTVGDINITLTESENLDLTMIPGNDITKDPVVTVKAGSEACWLFVKVEESANLDDFLTYTVAQGWTALEGVDGVYYREVGAANADTAFDVLSQNKVTVLETVTKEALNALTDTTLPTLTFTAYAVQKDNVSTVTDAWAKIGA